MKKSINRYEEDEIDLRELFKTISKNKKKIFLITGVITALAIVYILVKQPIYQVKSNIMIGYTGKDKDGNILEYIAEPAIIAKRLNLVFNVEDKLKVKDYVSEVSSVSINKKLKNFITIKTEAISNEEALKKNKEVIAYMQNLYQSKIDRFIVNTDNNIKAVEVKISNLENLETKNIQRQIQLLKTQKIIKIDEKIDFYKNINLKALNNKITLHRKKLKEYTKAVKDIYKSSKENSTAIAIAISSMQIVNYQNLILNSQNKIEDLKVEIEILKNQTIPNLQRDKNNLKNDALRKLGYKLNVELPYKKLKLLEEIEELKYNKSEQNVQNSIVIGEFVITDYPLKPKKKLIVIVAFITGLMFSIFLVFFLEFISGVKKEEKSFA